MEAFLAKIFATALALSQVTTAPDTVKTQFDRSRDQDKVAQLLRAGCAHMRKAFDIEDINLDDLIATAMDDSQAIAEENKVFRGINFADLETAYRQFCKNEEVPVSGGPRWLVSQFQKPFVGQAAHSVPTSAIVLSRGAA